MNNTTSQPTNGNLPIVHQDGDSSSQSTNDQQFTLEQHIEKLTSDGQPLTLDIVIQAMLNMKGGKLTVQDVKTKKTLALALNGAKLYLQNKQEQLKAVELEAKERAQQEQRAAEMEMGNDLFLTFRQEAGLKPLSADELANYKPVNGTSSQSKNGVQTESHDSVVPEEVLELKKDPRSKKLPDLVFQEGWMAQSVRCHLVAWVKVIQGQIRTMDRNKEKELFDLRKERASKVSELIRMCEVVITAWHLHWTPEYKETEWASPEQNKWMIKELWANYPEFAKIFHEIKLEDPEEKAKREQAAGAKERKEKHISDLHNALKARLLTTNPSLSEESANNMAGRVVRKKAEKYSVEKGCGDEVVTAIFTEVAINRMEVSENEKDSEKKEHGKNIAVIYARAAGMDENGLAEAVAALRKQREQAASSASATVAQERSGKFGEAKVVAPKDKKDKGGKKKGKDKPDDSKPTQQGGKRKK